MRIRIVTFGLSIPAEAYTAHAMHIAPGFAEWPGLLGKYANPALKNVTVREYDVLDAPSAITAPASLAAPALQKAR